jgi:aldehyde dehydrogenase (NAD+)
MKHMNNNEISEILDEHRKYFETGITRDLEFRLQQLVKLKQMIRRNEDVLTQALQMELHKSAYEAFSTEIGILYTAINYAVKNLKKWVSPQTVKTPLMLFGARSRIYAEPYGTVLIIAPFNYPVNLVFEPLIGAIAAGNCAVIKPSELTPGVSRIITLMIKETFDEAYIRVIEGKQDVTSTLINAPFDYIFFTGSPRVGKIVMEAAARRLIPVTLELGGKNPCIVDETADIDTATRKIAWGKFSNAGQICVAPDYMIVHKQVKTHLIDSLKKHLISFYGDDPRESDDFGRIINEAHTERLCQLIDHSKVVVGGDYDIKQKYIAPTILDSVQWNDRIMEEEIFGPILPVLEYENLDEVISHIKNKQKPLAIYIFTKDKMVGKKIIDNVSYGGGCINDVLVHVGNPHLPFGGVGTSGIGSYHGKRSFDTFSHMKSILERNMSMESDIMYPPYTAKKLGMIKKFLK